MKRSLVPPVGVTEAQAATVGTLILSGFNLPPAYVRSLPLLARGVYGAAFPIPSGEVHIPVIVAEKEGSGDVGHMLDALAPKVRIVGVMSDRLRGMLERRAWRPYTVDSPGYGPIELWAPPLGAK